MRHPEARPLSWATALWAGVAVSSILYGIDLRKEIRACRESAMEPAVQQTLQPPAERGAAQEPEEGGADSGEAYVRRSGALKAAERVQQVIADFRSVVRAV